MNKFFQRFLILLLVFTIFIRCSTNKNEEKNKNAEYSLIESNIENLFKGSKFKVKSKVVILDSTTLYITLESLPNNYIIGNRILLK